MSLAVKYRPTSLEEVIGNENAKTLIEANFDPALKKFRHQGWLLKGPYGCGKTTLARIMGHMVECDRSSFHEFNTSNTRGIDTIRDIEEAAVLTPIRGNVKIFMLDECHQLTGPAAEALLKIYEEPPPDVYIILATTAPEKLSTGLRKSGRDMKCEVQSLTNKELRVLLSIILDKEGIPEFPEKVLEKIVDTAEGVPREAMTLLDSVLTIAPVDPDKALEVIRGTHYSEVQINKLCLAMLNKNWKDVARMLKEVSGEPEQVRYAILGYMRAVLLNKGVSQEGDKVAKTIRNFQDSFIYSGKAGLALACYLSCRS